MMKSLTKKAFLAVLSLGVAITYLTANTDAYNFEEGAQLRYEFKEGDFNPYWFQEQEDVTVTQGYAYEINSDDAEVYREFKEGDFNPYWFQDL